MYQQLNMRSLIRIKMFRSFKSKEHIHKKGDDGMRLFEPRYEKTGFLHMRKQRRRSAAQ